MIKKIIIIFAFINANNLVFSQKTQQKNTDVLIISASTSGTSAAIASARNGSNTIMVEESPWIGGMFTLQGVGACDGNHNLNSGIWSEFRQKIRNHYGGADKVETGWVSNTLFEPSVGNKIFKEIASNEKKLQIINGFYLHKIIKKDNKILGAEFKNNQNQKLKIIAKITIDATDIGQSLKMANAEYRLGMDSKQETNEQNAPQEKNNIVQDLTWVAILKDFGKNQDKTIQKPQNYNPENFKGSCLKTSDNKTIDCTKMLEYGKLPNQKYMINWPTKGNDIYLNIIELSRKKQEKELQKAKNYTLQFVYYIQNELGFTNLGLADDEFKTDDLLAYAPYHREGRRVKGKAFLTYNHVAEPYNQKEKLYKTGISVGDYPVDHHHNQNPNAPDLGFPPVPSFNIPLGSLIPEKVENLIVSDKAISVSNLINGSTRLQPVVLLTGQAAGILASLSAKENKSPNEVSIRKVQQELLNQKAYIMPIYDVNQEDKDFIIIQKITSTGILKTRGEAYKWANRTWFEPENTISIQEFTQGLNQMYPEIKIENNQEILTEINAKNYLEKLGLKFNNQNFTNNPITKRNLAILINQTLNPFSKEIDFNGFLK